VEVRGGRLHGYNGNYSKFLGERLTRRKIAEAAAAKETVKATPEPYYTHKSDPEPFGKNPYTFVPCY
jgi:ATPase subunit of ABC transporter with duplicated ATPase domains